MKKDFLVTVIGIAVGQFLLFILTPVLTRMYSPEVFGRYSGLIAIASIIATIASLRLEVAIPSALEEHVLPLFEFALFTPVVICPVITVLLYSCKNYFLFLAAYLHDIPYWSICLLSILQGMVAVVLALCTRQGLFAQGAAIRIAQPLGFGIAAVTKLASLNTSLILGWVMGCLASLILLKKNILSFSVIKSCRITKNYWRYPLLSMPVALLDTTAVALPVIFIIAYFGDGEAGRYSQIQRLLGSPMILGGMAIGQVFYKYAGDLHRNQKNIIPLIGKVIAVLSLGASVLFFFVIIMGKTALSFILGSKWTMETNFILVAVVPILVRMVVSPVSSVFLVVQKLDWLALWQTSYFLVTITVFVIFRYSGNITKILLYYACSETIMYGLYLLLAIVAVRKQQYQ